MVSILAPIGECCCNNYGVPYNVPVSASYQSSESMGKKLLKRFWFLNRLQLPTRYFKKTTQDDFKSQQLLFVLRVTLIRMCSFINCYGICNITMEIFHMLEKKWFRVVSHNSQNNKLTNSQQSQKFWMIRDCKSSKYCLVIGNLSDCDMYYQIGKYIRQIFPCHCGCVHFNSGGIEMQY